MACLASTLSVIQKKSMYLFHLYSPELKFIYPFVHHSLQVEIIYLILKFHSQVFFTYFSFVAKTETADEDMEYIITDKLSGIGGVQHRNPMFNVTDLGYVQPREQRRHTADII